MSEAIALGITTGSSMQAMAFMAPPGAAYRNHRACHYRQPIPPWRPARNLICCSSNYAQLLITALQIINYTTSHKPKDGVRIVQPSSLLNKAVIQLMLKHRQARLRQRRPEVCTLCAALLAASLLPLTAMAGNLDALSLRGFGTLGASHSSQDDADFVGTFFQPNGAGYTRSWTASVDSKLGLQLDATVNDKLSAVLQVVSQYRYDGSYDPEVEWAYLGYQLTPDFTIRLGRIVAPAFMESETRLVGYTYLWTRPPQELYAINTITNQDGIDLRYRLLVGDFLNTFQLTYGKTTKKFPADSEADASHALAIQHILEHGSTTFRIAYMTVDFDITSPDLEALFSGLEQFANTTPGAAGTQALSNARRYRNEDTTYRTFTIGLNHNPGNWLIRSEWAQTDIDRPTSLSNLTAWHLTVGYRLGRLTPFLTFAEVKPDKLSTSDIPTAGLSNEQAQAAAALNAGLEDLVSSFAFSQESLSAGLRWDMTESVAVKLQLQHVRSQSGSGSSGRLFNPQPDFRPGDVSNVFSLNVDFVF